MANVIKIKRSETTATPSSLSQGELAYSELSDSLFIGTSGAGIDTIVNSPLATTKVNLGATTAPAAGNDNTEGYSIGSTWIDVNNNKAYIAEAVGTGTANWIDITSDGVTNLGLSGNASTIDITSDTGSDVTIPSAASGVAGLLTGAEYDRLVAMEDNSKDDQIITAGVGLSGGGTGDVTLDLDFSELTDKTTAITGLTEFILQDEVGSTESRKTAGEIDLSFFDNTLSAFMSSFSIDGDSGTAESVVQGDTINILGGDGVTTAVSATDTLTVSADLKLNGGLAIETNEIAVDLGASAITGTLAVADGGTGLTTITDGGVMVGSGTGAVTPVAGGANTVLTGTVGDPTFGKVTFEAIEATDVITAAEGIGSNDNDTTWPTTAAVKAYVDAVAASEMTYKGGFDPTASAGAGSPDIKAAASNIGDMYTVTASSDYVWDAAGSVVVTAGSFIVGQRYEIKTAGTTDFTLVGAADSVVGTIFTATGVGTGTGDANNVSQLSTGDTLIAESTGTLDNESDWTIVAGNQSVIDGGSF